MNRSIYTLRRYLAVLGTLIILINCAAPAAQVDTAHPLHQAAGRGDLSEVRYLLNSLDVNGRDASGSTPLMWAALNGRRDAARLLLESNANANSQNNNGQTPLMLTASQGNMDMIRLLLQKGARTEIKDIGGSTALVYATKNNHPEITTLLLQSQAFFESILRDIPSHQVLQVSCSIADLRVKNAGSGRETYPCVHAATYTPLEIFLLAHFNDQDFPNSDSYVNFSRNLSAETEFDRNRIREQFPPVRANARYLLFHLTEFTPPEYDFQRSGFFFPRGGVLKSDLTAAPGAAEVYHAEYFGSPRITHGIKMAPIAFNDYLLKLPASKAAALNKSSLTAYLLFSIGAPATVAEKSTSDTLVNGRKIALSLVRYLITDQEGARVSANY